MNSCAGGQVYLCFPGARLFPLCYGVGMLVVEPILSGLFNMVYDCFYPRDSEESSDDSGRIEEVSGQDSATSDASGRTIHIGSGKSTCMKKISNRAIAGNI